MAMQKERKKSLAHTRMEHDDEKEKIAMHSLKFQKKINERGGIQKELFLFFRFPPTKLTIHMHMHILDQKVCLVFPWIHYLTLQYI